MSVNRSPNTQKYAFTRRECLSLAYFPPQIEGYPTIAHTQIADPISYLKTDIGVMNQSVLNHFSAHNNADKIDFLKKHCATFLCPEEEISKALELPIMEGLYLYWILAIAYPHTPVLEQTSVDTNQLYRRNDLPIFYIGEQPEEDLPLKLTLVLDLFFIGPSASKIKLLNDAQVQTQKAKGLITGLLQIEKKLGKVSISEYSNWFCNYLGKFNNENCYTPYLMIQFPQTDAYALDKAHANCMIMSSQNFALYKLFEGNTKRAWTQQKHKLKNTQKKSRNYSFSEETVDMIDTLAKRNSISKTDLLERLVKEEYEKHTEKPPRM